MNIQIYYVKKNPNVLKIERYLKERKLKYQLLDLNKHKLGKKELLIFVNAYSAKELVDRSNKKNLELPVAHMSTEALIIDALLENPKALISPIVRNGNKVMLGFDEKILASWL